MKMWTKAHRSVLTGQLSKRQVCKKYNITRLVRYDTFGDVREAIKSEKRIRGWVRMKKIALIESHNPEWKDLSGTW